MNDNDRLPLALAILFIFVLLTIKLIKDHIRRAKLEKEKEELLKANIDLKAEHLKFRTDDHTLRNIVAELRVVSQNLYEGMDGFSKILNYILDKGGSHFVSIKEEITFIYNYCNMNRKFISEIDSIKINDSGIDKASIYYSQQCVPHLITAYFLENAFKHGDKNDHDFLCINLSLTNDIFEMNVVNKTRQKVEDKKGGIGLDNMKKRLDLLMEGKYQLSTQQLGNEYHSTLKFQWKN